MYKKGDILHTVYGYTVIYLKDCECEPRCDYLVVLPTQYVLESKTIKEREQQRLRPAKITYAH